MTTGKPTPRLSERLNADLEALRHENAALMASQLQSFRSDLTAIAMHARDTIEADTRMFLHATSGTMQSFQHRITRWLTLAPVILLATATAAITALLVLSWLWSAMLSKSELNRPFRKAEAALARRAAWVCPGAQVAMWMLLV